MFDSLIGRFEQRTQLFENIREQQKLLEVFSNLLIRGFLLQEYQSTFKIINYENVR